MLASTRLQSESTPGILAQDADARIHHLARFSELGAYIGAKHLLYVEPQICQSLSVIHR